jgi:NADH-quinone oxidoreductase subunit D
LPTTSRRASSPCARRSRRRPRVGEGGEPTAEVVVPIGPQHPALKEPLNFRVFAEGETITRLDLNLSYNHRGIEKAAEARDFTRAVPLLERVCGICSHAHTTAFVQGIEAAMGIEPPPRARYIRTAVAELERLHSHMLWLGACGPGATARRCRTPSRSSRATA